jgi:Sec-independent protein translocase protein TatA
MNFSISEIVVILLIALLVIKPEQLPDVAFSLGQFAKLLKRSINKIKKEAGSLLNNIEQSSHEPRGKQ